MRQRQRKSVRENQSTAIFQSAIFIAHPHFELNAVHLRVFPCSQHSISVRPKSIISVNELNGLMVVLVYNLKLEKVS